MKFTTEKFYNDEILPEIGWTRGERTCIRGMYECSGESKDGRTWSGIWHEKDQCVSISGIIDVNNYDGPGDEYYAELLNA